MITQIPIAGKDAIRHLRLALNDRPFTGSRMIFTYYQVVEAAELLHEHTRQETYRAFGYDLARRFQIIQPMYAWAYAFAAKLAETGDARIPHLAAAMYLDPDSWRASAMSREDIEKAGDWLRQNPFPAQPGAEYDDTFTLRSHCSGITSGLICDRAQWRSQEQLAGESGPTQKTSW